MFPVLKSPLHLRSEVNRIQTDCILSLYVELIISLYTVLHMKREWYGFNL